MALADDANALGYEAPGHRLEAPDGIVDRVQAIDRVEQATGEVDRSRQPEITISPSIRSTAAPFSLAPWRTNRIISSLPSRPLAT
jgi:hypothetical protein